MTIWGVMRRRYRIDAQLGTAANQDSCCRNMLVANGFVTASQAAPVTFDGWRSQDTGDVLLCLRAGHYRDAVLRDIMAHAARRLIQRAVHQEGLVGVNKVRFLKDAQALIANITSLTRENPNVFDYFIETDVDFSLKNAAAGADPYLHYALTFYDRDNERVCDSDFFASLFPSCPELQRYAERLMPGQILAETPVSSKDIFLAMMEHHYWATMHQVSSVFNNVTGIAGISQGSTRRCQLAG